MKSEETKKLALCVEKSSCFKTKRGVKICRHSFVEKYLATIWPNFSQTGQVAVDLEFKTN